MRWFPSSLIRLVAGCSRWSGLLLPLLFLKVVCSLSSFMLWRFLLIMYSSSIFPLFFVWLSRHVVDLELLSTAMRSPFPFVKSIISYILSSSLSTSFLSKYTLAAKNLVLLYFSSISTLSGFYSCLIITASFLLLVIIMVARILSTGEVKCWLDFVNPTILFLYT